VGLLHAGGLEVFEDELGEVGCVVVTAWRLAGVDQLVVGTDGEDAVGREAFDGERPGDADGLLVLIGLVVEVLEVGLGGDGGVDFLLAGDALFPPFGVEALGFVGPVVVGVAGDFPIPPKFC
jgi:hypothetical protein